jgi:thiol-disulfide isomerase/thioredoxin
MLRRLIGVGATVLLIGCTTASPGATASPGPDSSAPASMVESPASTEPSADEAASAEPEASAATDALLEFELIDVRTGTSFTLGELATEKPVLVETMAIWCTTCLAQQREVVHAHDGADFHSVGIDVDPNERAADLAEYAEREGFDWRFAMADAELVALLTDRYGFAVTNPPSTPTFVVGTDGTVRALEFGRLRSADELIAEIGAG